ncbi:unnamed protein product [Cercospora beticola]|nr:unnamed protein product [Cercospora beticola]
MAAMPSLSRRNEWATKFPAEIIKHIFSYLQPPSPETLGRARHEHIEFAEEHIEAINQFAAASHKDLLPKLKTNDAEHKIGLFTLSNASRACKRFRDITQPLLYESFPGQPVAHLQSLNRTLIARRDLARMVKNITIGEWDIDMLRTLDKWWQPTIARVGLSTHLIEAIHSKAEAGFEDAQVALLLLLCTEVQAIDICVPLMFKRSSIVSLLLTEVAQERPNTLFRGAEEDFPTQMPTSLPLRKLRTLSTLNANPALSVCISAFEKFMALKTVKRLTLFRTLFEPETLPCLPDLQELCLWRCRIGSHLGAALAGCGNLRSLKVIWPGSSMDYMQNVYPLDTVIDYEQIGDFITTHLSKLETLVLDPREAYLFGKSCKQLHSLDLSSMEHLKELSVEAQALWDQHVTDECPPWEMEAPLPRLKDILPPSLTKLAIFVDRRSDHMWAMRDKEYRITRNAKLMLYDCARYLIDAPTCFQSLHLDVPYMEIEPGLRELAALLKDLEWSADEVIGDPAVQRASPVVGATTPKEQRMKLRGIFGVWLPESGCWPSVVIEKDGEVSQDTDWEEWRKVMDQKIEAARGWFRWEQ